MSIRALVLSALPFLLYACDGLEGAPPEIGERSQPVGSLEQVTGFGGNPAQLAMYAYVPADMPAEPRPLVVAMHGCQQNASQYVAAGWNELAEALDFYVVYPQQNTGVNNQLGCFNWGGSWDGAPSTAVFNAPLHLQDLERGNAENQSIMDMVDHMKATYAIDDGRVYASGLSAGGAFTAVMLATWPDVFAGGIIVAGVPYGCTIVPNATTQHGNDCIRAHPETHQLNRTATEWGDLVRAANPGYSGPYPRVSIWHGEADYVVGYGLMHELVEQWTDVHGIDMEPDQTAMVDGANHSQYRDGNGQVLVETWSIPQMGHAQPIDPGEPCGSAGLYFSDVGLCAASRSLGFLGLDAVPDPDGPAVDVSAPASGSQVSGSVAIEVEASDPDGIDRVEVFVDGQLLDEVSAAPYVVQWEAGGATNGAHRIKAVAHDLGGAIGVDDDTTIYVGGGVGPDAGPDGPGADDGPGGFEGCACQGGGTPSGTLAFGFALWLLVAGRRPVRRRGPPR